MAFLERGQKYQAIHPLILSTIVFVLCQLISILATATNVDAKRQKKSVATELRTS